MEATLDSVASANGALAAGEYSCRRFVREAGNATWSTVENFRIASTVTLSPCPKPPRGMLYGQQGVQDDGGVEGATVTFDLGSPIGTQEGLSTITDRQAKMQRSALGHGLGLHHAHGGHVG